MSKTTTNPWAQPKPAPSVQPALLTPNDAAAYLGFSVRTLYGISAPRGALPVVRIGTGSEITKPRYRLADLDAYIASHTVTQQAEGGDV